MNKLRPINYYRMAVLPLLFQLTMALAAFPQGIRVANTAKYAGSGRYDWTVYLVAEGFILDTISFVEYTLHPSFPNPTRRVDNRQNSFALSSNGWGEFNIMVKIVYKDGRVSYLQHWLKLGGSITSKARSEVRLKGPLRNVTTGNTSEYVGSSQWNWTVYIASDDVTLNDVECVEYTLHPTFPDPVRRVCAKGSTRGEGFPLSSSGWGTFTIGVKVMFKDGDVRLLKHQLDFSGQRKQAGVPY